MKQKEGFILREVCGERVIVAEGLKTIDFGKLISLNETAAWLWGKAGEMGDFSIDQLTDALCAEYEVDAAQARKDVTAMVSQWQEIGLIERDIPAGYGLTWRASGGTPPFALLPASLRCCWAC